MLTGLLIAAAVVTADFTEEIGKVRPELHSSGFGPQICSCSKSDIEDLKSMGLTASRTHDWALVNRNQRVCDYFHIFPLMHLDATKPENYVFGPTDYLLKRTREELGHEIFFRLGTSIEHSGPKVHFNALIPDDLDKVAEIFAGTVRHYNKGWANGFEWGIKYWEIWNEPDYPNTMWCLPDGDYGIGDTPEEVAADRKARDAKRRDLFAALYAKSIKRIKSEFPDVKVGGPALQSLKEDYLKALFDACKKAGVAPDFISWHHYTNNPDLIMEAISRARKICDDAGFKDCELIINEWHYFGEYAWSELRKSDPDVIKRVWSDPGSHNGIDSSCFTLTMLSKFQTSELDQAFYYGCSPTGNWGYMDEFKRKYKVFYGLCMFGELMKGGTPVICASEGADSVTVFAVKSEDDRVHRVLVTDYRSGEKEIVLKIKGGIASHTPVTAWRHDHHDDRLRVPVRYRDGKVILKKADENSAAFLLKF